MHTTEQQWYSTAALDTLLKANGGLQIRQPYQWVLDDKEHAPMEGEQHLVIVSQGLNLHLCWQIMQALQGVAKVEQIQATRYAKQVGGGVNFTLSQIQGLGRGELEKLAQQFYVDLALLKPGRPSLAEPGLLVMDMDSTLIQMECIDQIARLAGAGQQVAEVTEQAMQGKLDFAESLYARVACLEHADAQILAQVRQGMPFMPGARRMIQTLKQRGWKLVVASGGFSYFADYVKECLQLDAALANHLEIQDGKLTGQLIGDVIDAQAKADALCDYAKKWSIEPGQWVALGDGANDLKMMRAATLGVAFRAKPVVQRQASAAIRYTDLDTLLHYLQ